MVAPVILGGIPIWCNPDQIRWNFKMKTAETLTVGGKVIQILGTTLGDITVQGAFGNGEHAKGETEAWQSQIRFRNQIMAWVQAATDNSASKPLRFTYSPHGWDFQVFVRNFSDIEQVVDEPNPKWALTLFPVDAGSNKIISGIKDLYIQRLMEGVGWKQSAYNGPSQAEVDAKLGGQSTTDYQASQTAAAYNAGLGGTTDGSTGTGATTP